jgi:hypothetical protein
MINRSFVIIGQCFSDISDITEAIWPQKISVLGTLELDVPEIN